MKKLFCEKTKENIKITEKNCKIIDDYKLSLVNFLLFELKKSNGFNYIHKSDLILDEIKRCESWLKTNKYGVD